MKKKLMFLVVAALFLSGGVLTAMQLTNKEKVSGLTLANIEAMTIGGNEDGGGTNISGCLGLWGDCTLPNGTKSEAPAIEVSL